MAGPGDANVGQRRTRRRFCELSSPIGGWTRRGRPGDGSVARSGGPDQRNHQERPPDLLTHSDKLLQFLLASTCRLHWAILDDLDRLARKSDRGERPKFSIVTLAPSPIALPPNRRLMRSECSAGCRSGVLTVRTIAAVCFKMCAKDLAQPGASRIRGFRPTPRLTGPILWG